MVVILAEGAANKRRTNPCERLELIVAGIHIFDDLLRRQRIVVVVCVGMVHQLAAAVYDGLGLLRILVRSVADHEKGRLDAVVREYIQDLLRVVRPPCGIKGNAAHLLIAFHAVDGQLARRN